MIIVGAKGFAKELLGVCHELGETNNLLFYDDVSTDLPEKLYEQFDILRSETEVKSYFEKGDKRFALGIGGPNIRKKMADKFASWGGELVSVISHKASVGHFGTNIEKGVCIMTGTVLTSDIVVEEGVLINLNCTIGHDVKIGAFSEICPGVHISGHVKIGKECFIGTGAVVLPGIELGNKVTVAAGAIVTRDVESNRTVKGIPAQ